MASTVWRMCVGCRGRDPNTALVRVVAKTVTGTNVLVVDGAARLEGRGAWVHPRPQCLRQAVSRRAFVRALRLTGAVDASALDQLVEGQAAGSPG
ncbi:MAG: YlxR family protein [Micrococcales bacterium]|nr:YlxR family protein [Micrococcales bacterium]